MKRKRIARKWYKIPIKLKDVNMQQFIAFNKINDKRTQLLAKIKEATSVQEQQLLQIMGNDYMDRMIAAISNIPYTVISKWDIHRKTKVYQWFEPIFKVIAFSPNPKKQIKRFKFNKQTFYLFEFGTMTAKQMLWLEVYWKQFYQELSEEIVNMNFEAIPQIIAISAFKKNEINTLINDNRELPFEIKPEYYKDFSKLVEERAEVFKTLPLDTVYGCLNFFFVNSRAMFQTTQTSMEITQEVIAS